MLQILWKTLNNNTNCLYSVWFHVAVLAARPLVSLQCGKKERDILAANFYTCFQGGDSAISTMLTYVEHSFRNDKVMHVSALTVHANARCISTVDPTGCREH